MEHELLKGEIYSKIVTIQKKYNSLLNNNFPTTGAIALTRLICNILELINKRYRLYTERQIKFINQLCLKFETIFSYLNESQILNVPWSIIPAIEKLFHNIKKDAGFVISPMITFNYSIIHSNIISKLKSVAESQDLLFDYTNDERLINDIDTLFSGVDDEIYFIFFPKLERVSALHFTLLGHEIGHTYSEEWINNNFLEFSNINDLEKKFNEIAKKEYKEKTTSTELEDIDLFSNAFVMKQIVEYIDISKKILNELISDIFGAFIFGDSSIIASYLFAIKKTLDDKSGWERGYLSWRFRDLECQVEGRSSWARLGLIVATATTVEPCYKGVITLELSNNGTMPIKLYPGVKIAQLIFHKTSEPYEMTETEFIKKKYNLSIGPGFSQAYKDKYIKYFCKNEED
jgi:hypothetical protein